MAIMVKLKMSILRTLALVVVIAMMPCRSTDATSDEDEPYSAITSRMCYTAFEYCLPFLTGLVGNHGPNFRCCHKVNRLYQHAPRAEDRREICEHLKKFATYYKQIVPEKVGDLPRMCNLRYPIPINAEADCSHIFGATEGEISLGLVQKSITKRKRSERQRATSEKYLVLEEEDREAAKCLIHMATGSWPHLNIRNGVMYECNICKRSFDSYQALGGHRAGHTKRKTTKKDKETLRPICHRVHKCLICGAEFPSGQALGGHKRQHGVTVDTKADSLSGTQSHVKTEEDSVNGFEWLDLNLPPAALSEEEINLALGSKKHQQPKQLQGSAPNLDIGVRSND